VGCGVGIAAARSGTRVVEQKKLTKGKSALLLVLSAMGAIASATLLHGWHVYLGFAIVGAGILIGFLIWNRKD
jgi:UDP-N-acetylmuramyl pentapeptide phosphotransferase/UDP-N-acetylglucosamine-1-phosphate transferase